RHVHGAAPAQLSTAGRQRPGATNRAGYGRAVQLQAVYRRIRLDAKRRHPAPPPPNWTVGPPDFVGIGAQRSGTTWWYDLVSSHPRVVHRGDLKELHYFHRYSQRPFTD